MFFLPVIVELEVSNRSIPSMLKDYYRYFADAMLHSVLGVKLLGTSKSTLPFLRSHNVIVSTFFLKSIVPLQVRSCCTMDS